MKRLVTACAILPLLLLAGSGCQDDGSSGPGGSSAAPGSTGGHWRTAMAALAAAPQPDPVRLEARAMTTWNDAIAGSWPGMSTFLVDRLDDRLQGQVGTGSSGLTLDRADLASSDLTAPPTFRGAGGGPAPALDLAFPGDPAGWELELELEATYRTTVAGIGVAHALDLTVELRDLRATGRMDIDASDPTRPRVAGVSPLRVSHDVDIGSRHPVVGSVLSAIRPVLRAMVDTAVRDAVHDLRQELLGLVGQPGPTPGLGAPVPPPLAGPPPSLESVALQVDEDIRRDHMPHDMIVEVEFDDPTHGQGNVTEIDGFGDSAIWTGSYLASLAYRQTVDPDPQAVATAGRVLDALERAVDVSHPQDGLLARFAIPRSSPFASRVLGSSKAFVNTVGGRDWVGVGQISRDQQIGVLFGLGQVAERMPTHRARATALLNRILAYLDRNDWIAYRQDGRTVATTFAPTPLHTLAALQAGRRVDPAWQTDFDRMAEAAPMFWLTTWTGTLDPLTSYYKWNLEFTSLVNLVELERDPVRYREYLKVIRLLRSTLGHHRNAWFDAVHAMAVPTDAPVVGPIVEDSLERWATRPRRGFAIRNSQDPSIPKVTYRSIDPSRPPETIAEHPLPVEIRPHTDVLWTRSPFKLDGGADPHEQAPGVDLVLPYWFARTHGLVR